MIQHTKRRLRLRDAHAGFQSAEWLHRNGTALVHADHRQRNEDLRLRAPIQTCERLRHDAEHGEWLAIDPNSAPNHAAVSPEPADPQAIVDHADRVAIGNKIIFRR
jgi:hypothetical protein